MIKLKEMKENNKIRVLFIAENIPTPKKKANKIIITIASKLKKKCEIKFIYPKTIVPLGMNLFPKYSPSWKLKSWSDSFFEYIVLPYIRLPIKSFAFCLLNGLPKAVIKKIKDFSPDIIHAHFVFPDSIIALQIKKEFSIPYVITVRASDIRLFENVGHTTNTWKKGITVLKNADQILCLNKGTKNKIQSFGFEYLTIIPHGIKSSEIISETSPENKITKEQTDNSITIISVGNAIAIKQIDWVIQAVLEYRGLKNVTLKIIGDGPMTYELKRLATNDSRIEFYGNLPREEVLLAMEKSHIFALPSYKESFGLVYLEAAAKKNAIIGFREEGVWGIFEEGKEALYVSNYSEFKEKLFFLISQDKPRNLLASAAHKKAKSFIWDNIEKMYIDIYTEITSKSAPKRK